MKFFNQHSTAWLLGLALALPLGIGGGTPSVPILNALRVPMHTAVGTGATLGMVISFPGALAFVLNGLDVPLRPPFSLGY